MRKSTVWYIQQILAKEIGALKKRHEVEKYEEIKKILEKTIGELMVVENDFLDSEVSRYKKPHYGNCYIPPVNSELENTKWFNRLRAEIDKREYHF